MTSTTAQHYQVLELPPTASPDDIKGAYRRLSRLWHPDKNDSPDATKKFQAIANAFQILTQPTDVPEPFVLAPLLRVHRVLFNSGTLQLAWGPGRGVYDPGAIYRLEVRIARPHLGAWNLLYHGPNSQFTATESACPVGQHDVAIWIVLM